MYQKILAPLDGSELSESILRHVKTVATGCQVPEVVLLTVIQPPQQVYEVSADLLRAADERMQAETEDYLSKVADSLKEEGIATQTATIHGTPADEILDYAKKNQVDLIIMSTHGRSGVSRWVFGSVADGVLRHSAVPVLIAPPPSRISGESRG